MTAHIHESMEHVHAVTLRIAAGLFLVSVVTASIGDRSQVYRHCLGVCEATNCTNEQLQKFTFKQPLHLR